MIKLSKSREKYLLETYFNTRNPKDVPNHLSQFGCRDGETTDEDLFFITQYVTSIDRLALGGNLVTEQGLQYLKRLQSVSYLDLKSMPLGDDNLDCILHLQNMEYLYIKFTNVTAEGISRILNSFPSLQTLVAAVNPSEQHMISVWQKQYPHLELIIS